MFTASRSGSSLLCACISPVQPEQSNCEEDKSKGHTCSVAKALKRRSLNEQDLAMSEVTGELSNASIVVLRAELADDKGIADSLQHQKYPRLVNPDEARE